MPALLDRLRRQPAAAAPGAETAEQSPDAASTGQSAAGTSSTDAGRARVSLADSRFGQWLGKPMTSFHLVIAIAALLVTLGLIMVLSASGVYSYDLDGSPWRIFGKQVLWTAIGLLAFWMALRMPIGLLRRLSLTGFVATVFLLILVLIPGIGTLSNGSRGWFVVAGMSMQPSELAKIAFAVWGAHLLATRRTKHASMRQLLIPLVPAAAIACGLIVAQPDLGQTVSFGIIMLGLLWYAGLPLKVFVTSMGAVVGAAAFMAVSAGYRSARVQSWLDPSSDAQGAGYQARQAKFALANGGVFGNGLGQGTAKYNYLPNAHNDFIFAIIGEELGFVGALGLLLLFALLAYTGMRIAKRSNDPFLRLLCATTTLWIIGQSFINVGYVIGLLPVTGLQLPLISAGGTSTATTLVMIGLMANAARHEPDAVAALRAGRDDRMNRILRLPLPVPYDPKVHDAGVGRAKTRPGPGTGAPKKAVPKNGAPKNGAPKKAVPKNAAPKKAGPKSAGRPAPPAKPARAAKPAPVTKTAKTAKAAKTAKSAKTAGPATATGRRSAAKAPNTAAADRTGRTRRGGAPEPARGAGTRTGAARPSRAQRPAAGTAGAGSGSRRAAQGRSAQAGAEPSAKVATGRSARSAATPRRSGGTAKYGELPAADARRARGRATLEGQRYA